MLPMLYTFLISFWIKASYWIAHHRIFGYIRAHDGALLRIKSVFLLWVVMVSFSASMIMEYGDGLEEGRQGPETGRMIWLPTDEHR